jgi:hypothetical protein
MHSPLSALRYHTFAAGKNHRHANNCRVPQGSCILSPNVSNICEGVLTLLGLHFLHNSTNSRVLLHAANVLVIEVVVCNLKAYCLWRLNAVLQSPKPTGIGITSAAKRRQAVDPLPAYGLGVKNDPGFTTMTSSTLIHMLIVTASPLHLTTESLHKAAGPGECFVTLWLRWTLHPSLCNMLVHSLLNGSPTAGLAEDTPKLMTRC